MDSAEKGKKDAQKKNWERGWCRWGWTEIVLQVFLRFFRMFLVFPCLFSFSSLSSLFPSLYRSRKLQFAEEIKVLIVWPLGPFDGTGKRKRTNPENPPKNRYFAHSPEKFCDFFLRICLGILT